MSSDSLSSALEIPLSDAQNWILRSEAAGRPLVHHVVIVFQLEGPLNRPALRAALDEVTARHERMRIVLRKRGGEIVQAIRTEDCGFTLVCQEVADDVQFERIRREELEMPFDLMSGPTVRGRLLRLSDESHVLLMTLHCLAFDRPSAAVMLQEFALLYRNKLLRAAEVPHCVTGKSS